MEIGQSLTPYCESGEEKNQEHFLPDCWRYHQEREEMKTAGDSKHSNRSSDPISTSKDFKRHVQEL